MLVQAASSPLQTVLLIPHFLSCCATSFPMLSLCGSMAQRLPRVSTLAAWCVAALPHHQSTYRKATRWWELFFFFLDSVADQKHSGGIPDSPSVSPSAPAEIHHSWMQMKQLPASALSPKVLNSKMDGGANGKQKEKRQQRAGRAVESATIFPSISCLATGLHRLRQEMLENKLM